MSGSESRSFLVCRVVLYLPVEPEMHCWCDALVIYQCDAACVSGRYAALRSRADCVGVGVGSVECHVSGTGFVSAGEGT